MIKVIISFCTIVLFGSFIMNRSNWHFTKLFCFILQFQCSSFLFHMIVNYYGWMLPTSPFQSKAFVLLLSIGLNLLFWGRTEVIRVYSFFKTENFGWIITNVSLLFQIYLCFFCLYLKAYSLPNQSCINFMVLLRCFFGIISFIIGVSFLQAYQFKEYSYQIILMIVIHWFVFDYWARDMLFFAYSLIKYGVPIE